MYIKIKRMTRALNLFEKKNEKWKNICYNVWVT